MSAEPTVQQVLVLEPDRLCAAVLARSVAAVFPRAEIHCESEPGQAAVLLAERPIDLFVVAMRGFDLDVVTLLSVWAEHDADRTRVLVVTPDPHSTAVVAVRALPIGGVFDTTTSDLADLENACRTVASGGNYVGSATMTDAARLAAVRSVGGATAREGRMPGRGAPPNNRWRSRLNGRW